APVPSLAALKNADTPKPIGVLGPSDIRHIALSLCRCAASSDTQCIPSMRMGKDRSGAAILSGAAQPCCGIVNNAGCDASAPTSAEFKLFAPPPPKPAIACTSSATPP